MDVFIIHEKSSFSQVVGWSIGRLVG